MPLKNPRFLAIAYFTLLIFISFIRENVMLVLNGAIQRTHSYKAYIEIPDFLYSWSPVKINLIKWIITVIVFVSVLKINFLIIRKLFPNTNIKRTLLLGYTFIALLAGVLFLVSATVIPNLYRTAHDLLRLTQGPLLTIFSIVYCTLIHYFPKT